jgi:hypothetical protein
MALWPADSEAQLPHHTLERLEVVQSVRSLVGDHSPFVRWTYVSGTTRVFRLGEEVVVEVPGEDHESASPPIPNLNPTTLTRTNGGRSA